MAGNNASIVLLGKEQRKSIMFRRGRNPVSRFSATTRLMVGGDLCESGGGWFVFGG